MIQQTDDAQADPFHMQPVALAHYVDLEQRISASNNEDDNLLDRVPMGLWGMGIQGKFRFDVVVIVRTDGVWVFGYTNADGVVDEIRIDKDRDGHPDTVWARDDQGGWRSAESPKYSSMYNESRLGDNGVMQLRSMFDESSGAEKADMGRRRQGDHRGMPNRM